MLSWQEYGFHEVIEFFKDQLAWLIHMFLSKHFPKRKGGGPRDEVQRNGRKLVFTFFLHVAYFARHRIVLINLACSPLYYILFLALGLSLIHGIFIFLGYFEEI